MNSLIDPIIAALQLPKQGRGIRDTSRAAFHADRDSGKLSRRQREVYTLLCQVPERDMTRAEIAQALGMTAGAACGRVKELLDIGVIVETPRRRCAQTGAESHGVKSK